jgi:cytidylate kinase
LRVISYSRQFGGNVGGLLDIFRSYPSPKLAIYLTCTREERFRRLELRAGQKKEDIYEKLLRKDPESFFAIDKHALDLYRDSFGCEVIDTTGLSDPEVFEQVSEI